MYLYGMRCCWLIKVDTIPTSMSCMAIFAVYMLWCEELHWVGETELDHSLPSVML